MSSDAIGGITFAGGSVAGSKYAVKPGRGNMPVVYVSWYDAARMANWMNNGQGTGSTESGVYTLTDNTTISGGRSAGAKVAIPSENEWYKAAYYQPAAAGGDADGYWFYPTKSNTTPTSEAPAGGSNSGNYYNVLSGIYAVGAPGYLSDAGAYSNAAGFYGTFDLGGNVFEWNETLVGSSRGARGGSFSSTFLDLGADRRNSGVPANEYFNVGFRLANIPEPTSVLLVSVGSLTCLKRRRA